MIKIAIIGTGLMGWGGGIDFLIDFIKVLRRHPKKYYCEVFLPKKTLIECFARKILGKHSYYNSLDRITKCLKNECPDVSIIDYVNRFWSKKHRYKDVKNQALKHKIDILMPMSTCIDNVNDDKYITVGYITDFQHKHIPEYFSEKEINARDQYFRKLLNMYDFTFTQSQDTVNDIRKYYGKIADNVYVMYAYPHEILSQEIKIDIEKKYKINNPYFLVSNQFWLHKNHQVAFDALELLYKKGLTNILVVCTGDTHDYRNQQYFPSLLEHINSLECKENIKILGYIDKTDQVYLMKHCVSLIQPTLFEGNPGGGAVVDAEAYGTPCIVSDIPVNLEIPKCYDVSYFKAKDSEDLALKMEEAISNYNPDKIYQSKADYEAFYDAYDAVLTDMINQKRDRRQIFESVDE